MLDLTFSIAFFFTHFWVVILHLRSPFLVHIFQWIRPSQVYRVIFTTWNLSNLQHLLSKARYRALGQNSEAYSVA